MLLFMFIPKYSKQGPVPLIYLQAMPILKYWHKFQSGVVLIVVFQKENYGVVVFAGAGLH